MNTSSVSRFNALRASVSNVVQLPLPIEGFPGEKQGNGKGNNDKGWNYLLSNTVSFSKSVDHAIRIQKPEKEKMPEWIVPDLERHRRQTGCSSPGLPYVQPPSEKRSFPLW